MIPQTEIPQLPVVLDDVLAESDDSRFVLVVKVSFDESFVEFYGLAEGEVLAGSLVESTTGLDHLGKVGKTKGREIRRVSSEEIRLNQLDSPSESPNPAS